MPCVSSQDEIFLAGQSVAPGLYREVQSGAQIRLLATGALPPNHSGRVAVYLRVHDTWGQLRDLAGAEPAAPTARRVLHRSETHSQSQRTIPPARPAREIPRA